MAFPSIKSLAKTFLLVMHRFPFETLFALTGTIAATARIELININPVNESHCWRIIMAANLGLLLSLAVSLFAESKNLQGQKKLSLRLIAFVLTIGLFYAINPYENNADTIRFFLLSLAFHLIIAFAAFTQPAEMQGFWQFNKTLFLRFLTSVLYSMVLFAGLAAAIGALNFLFNFKFEWDTFSVLWVWIAGMFNTLFFLAGIPANLKQLNTDTSYPKGLKIFTQFVLIPLASVYVVILLAYELKLLLQWHLPKGLVSSLILGYAVFGILALLLVFPIRGREENKWIKTYARSFYFLLLPLLVLLFLAVGARVFKYGVTEPRYFLILLAFWLLFISIYFLVSAKQNIKVIPISLCILTLMAIYGPQSAFNISLTSQRQILKSIFAKNHAYQNGLLIPVDSNKITYKDGNHAVAVLDNIITHYDIKALQPFFKKDLQLVSDSLGKLKSRWNVPLPISKMELQQNKLSWTKKALNLNRFSGYDYDSVSYTKDLGNSGGSFQLKIKDSNITSVSGYDYLIETNSNNMVSVDPNKDSIQYRINKTDWVKITENNYRSSLKINGQPLVFNVQTILDSLVKSTDLKKYKDTSKTQFETTYILPAEKLTFSQSTGKHRVALRVNQLSYEREAKSGKNKIIYISAVYLIR